jgi:hypothetical protein
MDFFRFKILILVLKRIKKNKKKNNLKLLKNLNQFQHTYNQ